MSRDGGTSFANTNKVPFFRHSVRLSPSGGARGCSRVLSRRHKCAMRHACVRACTHYFTRGRRKTYLPFPAGQAPWFVAENQARVESRVAIKALAARLSVFPTCSTLLSLSSVSSYCRPSTLGPSFCHPMLLYEGRRRSDIDRSGVSSRP